MKITLRLRLLLAWRMLTQRDIAMVRTDDKPEGIDPAPIYEALVEAASTFRAYEASHRMKAAAPIEFTSDAQRTRALAEREERWAKTFANQAKAAKMEQAIALMELGGVFKQPDPEPHIAPKTTLLQDIETAINRHSRENVSNTPDFILANAMMASLSAVEFAIRDRETWYGRDLDGPLGTSGNFMLDDNGAPIVADGHIPPAIHRTIFVEKD